MMFALAAPMMLTGQCDRMHSASDVGQELRQSLSGVHAHMRNTYTFGEPWHRTASSLADLMAECSHPGWDGDEAAAISPAALRNAIGFIRSIPFTMPVPEISATPAGDITFEWAQSALRVVTVALGENGEVHYASLNGQKKTFGSYPLDETFEPELLRLIETVLG